MKKSLFENCPGCGDPMKVYELPRRLRAGKHAVTAKRYEEPQWWQAWRCKRPDWEFHGMSGDKCCNNWNYPSAWICFWCGTERNDNYVEIANAPHHGNLPVAPQPRWMLPHSDPMSAEEYVQLCHRNKGGRVANQRRINAPHRDGWAMV